MAHTDTTSVTTTITPYREADAVATHCVAAVRHAPCAQPAHVRCRRCGRGFCLDHAADIASRHCAACEQAFVPTARRVRRVAFALALGSGATLALGLFGGVLVPAAAFTLAFGAFGLVLGSGEVAVSLGRRRFRRQGRYEWWISDAPPLEIAPRDDAPEAQPLTHIGIRNRLEPPIAPMWQRTYGR